MSRSPSRVFLQTNSELRAFFWFSLGSDGSIYFSSSNAKLYRRGFHGSAYLPIGGAHVSPELDGRALSQKEIENHHSLHNSGVFSLPTMSEDRRDRHVVTQLDTYVGPIPLLGILPMEPSKYPVTLKTVKPSSDLVIDVTSLRNQPFAMMFYVKRKTEEHPSVWEMRKEWSVYCRMQTSLGGYDLCVIVYANPSTFRSWQELEITITSRPETIGGDLAWPIFGSS